MPGIVDCKSLLKQWHLYAKKHTGQSRLRHGKVLPTPTSTTSITLKSSMRKVQNQFLLPGMLMKLCSDDYTSNHWYWRRYRYWWSWQKKHVQQLPWFSTMASTEICWPSTTTRCLWFPCRGKKYSPAPVQKKNEEWQAVPINRSSVLMCWTCFFFWGGGENTRKTNPKCIVPTCFFTPDCQFILNLLCPKVTYKQLHPSFLELPKKDDPNRCSTRNPGGQNGPPPPGGCLHVTKQSTWTRQCHTMNPQAVPVIIGSLV